MSHAADCLQKSVLFRHQNQNLRVLELGSGCGIVSIMLALQRPGWSITGIEIQPHLSELAVKNAILCGAKVAFLNRDLRQFADELGFDLIISNPPWQKAGSGRYSPRTSRNTSRFETHCTMEDVLACAKRNLAPSGEAVLLYPESRRADLEEYAPNSSLDIISCSPASGITKHVICLLRHEGMK